LPTL
ncbi:hypothetical protein D046_4937C, partial [Vibrio parahaemolyticus V-223/04]|jgi:hypothetical protein